MHRFQKTRNFTKVELSPFVVLPTTYSVMYLFEKIGILGEHTQPNVECYITSILRSLSDTDNM